MNKMILLIGLSVLISTAAFGAVLDVGVGRTYETVADAYASSATGDEIEIYSGYYNTSFLGVADSFYPADITFRAVEGELVRFGYAAQYYSRQGYLFDGVVFMSSGTDSQFTVNSPHTTFQNCIFYNNQQASKGMGLITSASDTVVKNCTFFEESGRGYSAAGALTELEIIDSLFVGNGNVATTSSAAIGAFNGAGNNLTVTYSAFWDNKDIFLTNDTPGPSLGTGCVTTEEPIFASTDITSPYFMQLSADCPVGILEGSSTGEYIGARGLVPEPVTMGMLIIGSLGIVARRIKK